MPRKKAINPFYIVLLVAGVAFCVTASAYGVMMLRTSRASAEVVRADAQHPLQQFVGAHGNQLIVVELLVLGLATIAAIGTEQYWDDRHRKRRERQSPPAPQRNETPSNENPQSSEAPNHESLPDQ